MPAIIPIGAAIVGGVIASSGAKSAAKAQAAASDRAMASDAAVKDQQIALQREQMAQSQKNQQPWLDAGGTGLTRLQQLLGLQAGGADNGSAMRNFSAQDFQSDPGYQFRMDQGQQALERSAAARGGLMSGAALKDTARFSQGLASQDYQSAFDRFQTNRANKLNPLQSLANVGQTTANNLGAAGQNAANGMSSALGQFGASQNQNITGAGNARASGYIARGNALNSALSQGANMYQQNQLMGQLGNQFGNQFANNNAGVMQSTGLSANELMGAF